MTSFLVLEEIEFSREPFRMALAGGNGARICLRSVDLAFVPVETPFIAESGVFAVWD
jgi:hypothetical protein